MLFRTPEYGSTVNSQWFSDISQYDLSACIDSISVLDVEYVSPDSSVFTEDNSGQADIDFGHVTGQEKCCCETSRI